MEKNTKNIFISHYGGDEKYITKFKKLIGSGIDVRDSSIVETEPNRAKNEDYIKYHILAPQIDWAGVVIVLIGKETRFRDYVNWEIEYANRKGKRLVGVFLPGADDDDVPEGLKKYGDALVPWDEQKMIGAINGDTEWETSSGSPYPEKGSRGVC